MSFKSKPKCNILSPFLSTVSDDCFSLLYYEQMAFKYLSWLLYPLFGCYAVYSLLYVEHKGWYSWVLSMLYGFLLTFGEFVSSSYILHYLPFRLCLELANVHEMMQGTPVSMLNPNTAHISLVYNMLIPINCNI